jgi:hypothetical protein
MTAWIDLVKKVYSENKGKPGYKLGDAIRDAKKQYKKPSAPSAEPSVPKEAVPVTKKRRVKARKSRRNRGKK